MNRRELLTTLAGVGARTLVAAAPGPARWPFDPPDAKQRWTDFRADGFSVPVRGIVYDGSRLDGGVPLGGLGTGYITLDGSGKLGFSSIFNDLVPPKKVFADWLQVQAGDRTVPLSSAHITYWGHFPVADLQAELSDLPLRAGIRAFTPFVIGDAAVSPVACSRSTCATSPRSL